MRHPSHPGQDYEPCGRCHETGGDAVCYQCHAWLCHRCLDEHECEEDGESA